MRFEDFHDDRWFLMVGIVLILMPFAWMLMQNWGR